MMDLLKWIPPHWAHRLAPWGVQVAGELFGEEDVLETSPFQWRGLRFPHRWGVAGGVDKRGDQVLSWQKLGAGFVETGTFTPEPQGPNPGTILLRDWDQKFLWNKMGFPNAGAVEALEFLQAAKRDLRIPLFVNIGKNRGTAAENAASDYVKAAQTLSAVADLFVINVSSPNTAGLRSLQAAAAVENLINTLRETTSLPLLLKLSPDLDQSQLQDSLFAAVEAGVSGFILTNTTTGRPLNSTWPSEGGLSGAFLTETSRKILQWTLELLGSRRQGLLIVSAGGILTPEEGQRRLEMGADLLQVYSALVFSGPRFFQKVRGTR